ncbi:hypothetical protein D3C85_595610 [compost metagenome]
MVQAPQIAAQQGVVGADGRGRHARRHGAEQEGGHGRTVGAHQHQRPARMLRMIQQPLGHGVHAALQTGVVQRGPDPALGRITPRQGRLRPPARRHPGKGARQVPVMRGQSHARAHHHRPVRLAPHLQIDGHQPGVAEACGSPLLRHLIRCVHETLPVAASRRSANKSKMRRRTTLGQAASAAPASAVRKRRSAQQAWVPELILCGRAMRQTGPSSNRLQSIRMHSDRPAFSSMMKLTR